MKKDKNSFGYRLLRPILGPMFKWYYNVKIINKDVIPKNGPIILCGNHLNFKDQFPVIISTKRVIHWLSKREYFDGPNRWFFKFVGCISVDRSIHDKSAKDSALAYLNDGFAIGLFPEGTRNKTNATLLPFKFGAVSMAQKSNATIIPFAVTGDYKFRSKNTIVRFGKPMTVGKDQDLDSVNNDLRNEVLELQRLNYKETNYKRI
jgi:1-acyl-sn-glycerol-3-phosphate acyltransferase